MYFLLVFFTFKIVFGEQLINCPRSQLRFDKIIGLRPSSEINGYLLHKHENFGPVTLDCIKKCLKTSDCSSFVIFYNISECHWYNIHIEGFQENEHVIDANVVWFKKNCLEVKECDKLWIFERIPGATLIGNNLKTLPNKVTRRECQQSCLNSINLCRSVKFRIYEDVNDKETVGICILSDTDRHLMPNSFRVASYNEEYFENQCTNVTSNTFCAYEEYEKGILEHVEMRFGNKTRLECENICDNTAEFHCRGFSLLSMNIYDKYTCLIHSENTKIHGPKLLKVIDRAKFFERARCLNITVSCSDTFLNVVYEPEVDFHGKLYMSGYSDNLQCYVNGKGKQSITLKLPLFNNRCGISIAKNLNRTLFSGTMVLQYNSLVQTQGDRVVKIGCIFSDDAKIVLGTGVNFANLSYPSKSTTIVNATTIHPTVEMRIVDFYTGNEVSDTQIGQELQLIIEVRPSDGPFDIVAGHLVAMTEDGQDSMLLLDDLGCPTNLNIFPGLTKIHNNETKKLVANFFAFKFTSSPIIRFSVIVQFCPTYCTPSTCGNTILQNRTKREIPNIINATVKEVNKDQFDNYGKIIKMPLEFIFIVRTPKISSNKLVYGDNNKVLIAGYDVVTNEICIDFSLLIGTVMIWIITQIMLLTCGVLLVRRYRKHYQEKRTMHSLEELHKNFGLGFSNLENRRVHWADKGSFA
ncbi:hypothetical protein FQA39_LY02573 [Lamprigera yunnana]|nr:hypothetical protein FQA39_LY02573 [Lamprigera yunnana]